MPSKSAAQHNFMEAIAHSPKFAKKAGVPQSVGKDFTKADDKAGITKSHGGSPKSKEEHMAKRRKQGATIREIGAEHGVSKSTAHRKVSEPGSAMPKEGVEDVKTSLGKFRIRGS